MAESNDDYERYIPEGEPAYKVKPHFTLQRHDDKENPQVLLAIDTSAYFEDSTGPEEKTLHLVFDDAHHLREFARSIGYWLAEYYT